MSEQSLKIGTKMKLLGMGVAFFLLIGCYRPTAPSGVVQPSPSPQASSAALVPAAEMLFVPGGNFTMGSADLPNAQPIQVTTSSFYLDVTPVTVEAYVACVAAGDCTGPVLLNDNGLCNYIFDKGQWKIRPGKEKDPINCISFEQAKNYCAIQAKRLPTEIEWEYVARGTTDRFYPWGDFAPSPNNTCWRSSQLPGTCPVKTHGTSLFGMNQSQLDEKNLRGVTDMSGNVWQWVDTKYLNQLQASNEPCKNQDNCVIRGASWSDVGYVGASSILRSSYRSPQPIDRTGYGIGFRCARDASCETSSQCGSPGHNVCSEGQCVECIADAQCQKGYSCIQNSCVSSTPCTSDKDCSGVRRTCDTTQNLCTLPPTSCRTNADCQGQQCDVVEHVCKVKVEIETDSCAVDADCASGFFCDGSEKLCKPRGRLTYVGGSTGCSLASSQTPDSSLFILIFMTLAVLLGQAYSYRKLSK